MFGPWSKSLSGTASSSAPSSSKEYISSWRGTGVVHGADPPAGLVGGEHLVDRLVVPVAVAVAPAGRARGERRPGVEVVALADQGLGHLAGRRIAPVGQLDGPGVRSLGVVRRSAGRPPRTGRRGGPLVRSISSGGKRRGDRRGIVEGEVLVVVLERAVAYSSSAASGGSSSSSASTRSGSGCGSKRWPPRPPSPVIGSKPVAPAGRTSRSAGSSVAEREAQGGTGPDRRRLGPVAVARLVVPPTGGDIAAFERLGGLLGADDAHPLGRISGSIVFRSAELVVHLGPPLASISPRAAPAPCAGAPRRSRPPGRG